MVLNRFVNGHYLRIEWNYLVDLRRDHIVAQSLKDVREEYEARKTIAHLQDQTTGLGSIKLRLFWFYARRPLMTKVERTVKLSPRASGVLFRGLMPLFVFHQAQTRAVITRLTTNLGRLALAGGLSTSFL